MPFRSSVPLPHHLPQGLPHPHCTPNHGWVPLGVGSPPLPQPPLRGAGPGGPAFTFAPLPSLPLPQDPVAGGGPRWAEDQAWDLSRLLGRGSLAMLPLDPLPSQWSPNFPLQVWDPFPSPSCPSGLQSCPASTSPPPSLLPRPMSYPVAGGSSHPLRCPRSLGVPPIPLGVRRPLPGPGRCPSCVETRIPRPPGPPS